MSASAADSRSSSNTPTLPGTASSATLRSSATAWVRRPYAELTYQPMLELLTFLRANGFKTFIVSGGGVEFMRPMTANGMPDTKFGRFSPSLMGEAKKMG